MAELVKLDGEAEDLPGIIPEMDALNRWEYYLFPILAASSLQ